MIQDKIGEKRQFYNMSRSLVSRDELRSVKCCPKLAGVKKLILGKSDI